VVGDSPLGPFTPQSDPLSFKPGGFARGAGHGSTFQDNSNNYWHISTISISVKNNFERRLGIWPTGFDEDGVMHMDASFGDYPHYLPGAAHPILPDGRAIDGSKSGGLNSREKSVGKASPFGGGLEGAFGGFTGWMLLNYKKPVLVSSTLGSYNANNAVDESIKTYWSAASDKKGEWIQTDLGNISTVNAIQINYADQDVKLLGKQTNIFHQYKLYYSIDGNKWKTLVDKSNNKTDVPH